MCGRALHNKGIFQRCVRLSYVCVSDTMMMPVVLHSSQPILPPKYWCNSGNFLCTIAAELASLPNGGALRSVRNWRLAFGANECADGGN